MRNRFSATMAAFTFLFVIIGGCTAAQLTKSAGVATTVQKGALTVASATTNPIVLAAGAVSPQAEVVTSTVGTVAKAIAAGASLLSAGLLLLAASQKQTISTQTAQLNSQATQLSATASQASVAVTAATEIIGDIAAYKNPGVPWTTSTEKFLVDIGQVATAFVQA